MSRLASLKALMEKVSENPRNSVIDPAFFIEISKFHTAFDNAIKVASYTKQKEMENHSPYENQKKKTKLYISHFIQVLNFAILRGELKPKVRTFYGIAQEQTTVPPLNTDEHLLDWGQKIIDGEHKRIATGGNPIYCPSIALVKVNYNLFKEISSFQKALKDKAKHYEKELADIRNEANALIRKIWEHVEKEFSHIKNTEKKIELCKEYGIVYAYRKGEKEKIRRRQELEAMNLKLSF